MFSFKELVLHYKNTEIDIFQNTDIVKGKFWPKYSHSRWCGLNILYCKYSRKENALLGSRGMQMISVKAVQD